jgi:hypothetical protein
MRGFLSERKNSSWFLWTLFLCFFLLEIQKKEKSKLLAAIPAIFE